MDQPNSNTTTVKATHATDEASVAAKDFVAAGHRAEPKSWWFGGDLRSWSDGWPTVFKNANYHCVYCRKNLSLTIEDLIASTTDHVIPQSLFTGTDEKGPNHLDNLVPCCSVCNSIKGSWYPEPGSEDWSSRKAFIAAARKKIRERKDDRLKDLTKHLGAAIVNVWDPKDVRFSDFQ